MKALTHHKQYAVQLRKSGKTYSEILSAVPVAKSTLSMWLKNAPLTSQEKKILKKKTIKAHSKGRIRAAYALTQKRIKREKEIFDFARKLYGDHKHEMLFVAGIALYWGEGSKRSSRFGFTNSDEYACLVIKKFIDVYLYEFAHTIRVRLSLHKAFLNDGFIDWWAKKLDLSLTQFYKVTIKKSDTLYKKRPQYRGCIRIELAKRKPLIIMYALQMLLVEDLR